MWITLAWTIIAVFQFLFGYATVQQFDCDLGGLKPLHFLEGSILTGILAGLLGGSFLVLVWENWLRSKNYGVALLYIFCTYCIIYVLVALPNAIFFHSYELKLPSTNSKVWEAMWSNFFDLGQLQSFFIWLTIVLGTLIVLQVNDKYGPGVFRSFLLGKYFHPTREERIFMFLDLRSSTTIAEKLGEERYFHFIKNVFKDATPPILEYRGEIYQYVGDEIVVSWKVTNGIKDASCIRCFLDIQTSLRQKSKFYQEHYDGLQPEFKAGLHYGYVMAGEVGVVKRDISYTGDVLNTTARIQSKCNELGVDILFSKYLSDKLKLKPEMFAPKKLGEIELKGKEKKITLMTL